MACKKDSIENSIEHNIEHSIEHIKETIDDKKDDKVIVELIDEMIEKVEKIYIHEDSIIDKLYETIKSNKDERIILLKEKEVLMWLLDDVSFLPTIEKKNKTIDEKTLKVLEDKWGQEILKKKRPDLKLDKQWTNKFGEHICEELFILLGKEPIKPKKKEHYQPDCEIDDIIIEVKTGTYFTSGTAGEKILGSPFKYAEIPELYGKPLHIICMGGAEKLCREKYGNLEGTKCSPIKKKFLDFFKGNNIYFIGISDILKSIIK
jgi:hypothetical protein